MTTADSVSVIKLERRHEIRQLSDGSEHFQDSVVLVWWDLENHIGGYHRIGIHPHLPDGPKAHLTNTFFAKDCVYKRAEMIPLGSPTDLNREEFYDCGDGTCTFEFTDHAIWRFNQSEVFGELHITDNQTPFDAYPKNDAFSANLTAGHLEVGSTVSGNITLNGTHYTINGLAFRDHGWGIRHWDVIVNHRWIAASFGPKMTLLAFNMQTSDDKFTRFACVIRGDEVLHTNDADIVTFVEVDGITHRGGAIDLTFKSGERMHFDIVPFGKGAVSWMADKMSTTDILCKITCGDLVGICDFEMSTNPARGTVRPLVAINGFVENGLHLL